MPIVIAVAGLLAAILVPIIIIAIAFRIVVPTNETHIVQSAKGRIAYGMGATRNVYYNWPSWVPRIGVKVIKMPLSNFDLTLESYDAYDKGRLPFALDIMAFFRIDDPLVAAERVRSIEELKHQLVGILQGASRSILAQHDIQDILEKRSEFGHMFTEATSEQLKAWGASNVKTIELMDIHDVDGSQVIHNIMAMKKSEIERASRVTVANNQQTAREAEIAAKQAVDTRAVEADQLVAMRGVLKDRTVQISTQEATQAVRDQEVVTASKTAEVQKVQLVRAAEIERERQVVAADQKRQTMVIDAEGRAKSEVAVAEGDKAKTVLIAEGDLQKALNAAKGIEAEGLAKGEAIKAEQLASVVAQTTLAKEIGENQGYQQYLISVRQVEAGQVVGVAQAGALEAADIKVIVNGGTVPEGMKGAMEIFTPKGGTLIASAVEGFAQTEVGEALLKKMGVNPARKVPANGTIATKA